MAIAINAGALNQIDFIDKTLRQKIQAFLRGLKHLTDKCVQTAHGAATGTRQGFGVAIRVEHQIEFAHRVGVKANRARL